MTTPNQNQAKAEIRNRGYQVAEALLGQPARVNGKHSEFTVPWRRDDHPSLHVYHDDGGWHDRGRGDKGDVFDLVARIRGLDVRTDFPAVLDAAARAIGVRLPDPEPAATAKPAARPDTTPDALAARYGLTWADFERHGCTVGPWRFMTGKPAVAVEAPAVLYPVATTKGGTGCKAKSVERLERRPDGSTKRLAAHAKGSAGFFPAAGLTGNGPLVLAGGEEKALAAATAGYRAVCATTGEGKLSAALAAYLVEAGNREFIVAMDADNAGVAGAQGTASRLMEAGATSVRVVAWPSDARPGRDLNDVLVDGGPAAVAALLTAAQLFVPVGPGTVGDYNLTDLGNAERLLAAHGTDLRYAYAINAWHVWDGRRWKRDDGAAIGKLAAGVARQIYAAGAACTDPDKRKELVKWGVQSESARKIGALVELARPHAAVDVAEFDRSPWILNVENGTMDLRTGELRPHRREDVLTKLAPVRYDPKATCQTWLAFLERIMDGNAGLIQFLRRAVGYSLTGDTSEQCLFLLYGTGKNGKSTFLETLKAILGEYARQADPASFMAGRAGESGGARPDLVALRGARFVPAIETESTHRLAESVLKSLTGGDTISVRGLYEAQQEFTPQFKLWLAANYKPDVRGRDQGIWRRIKLVPFTVQIPEEERDKGLKDKLLAEASGILNWALEGCQDWLERGLRVPPEVDAATAEYQEDTDVLAAWIREKCVQAGYAVARLSDLFSSYSAYAESGNERPVTSRALCKMLQDRGFKKDRNTFNQVTIVGLALKDEENA